MNIFTALTGASVAMALSAGLAAQTPLPPQASRVSTIAATAGRNNVITAVQGSAVDTLNRPLPDVTVRLRDARLGRITDVITTDKTGQFLFRGVEPGSYVVELTQNSTVMAASQLININLGETASATVKLPLKKLAEAGILADHPRAATAAAIAAAAASSGILTTSATGFPVTPE